MQTPYLVQSTHKSVTGISIRALSVTESVQAEMNPNLSKVSMVCKETGQYDF